MNIWEWVVGFLCISSSYEVCTLGSANPTEDGFKYYKVGVLMASQMNYPFDLERCGPAIDMALAEINRKFLSQHKIKLTKVQSSYPTCSGTLAPGLAADMHFLSDVIAFVGPACLFALEPVARLSAYWNIPIITGMGDQPQSEGQISVTSRMLKRYNVMKAKNTTAGIFADKSKYPTLTRMSYCQCRLTNVFESIFKQFSWKHIALIFDRSDLFSLTVGKVLEHGLRKSSLLTYVKDLDGSEDENIVDYLKDASMYSRVIILCVRGPLVREFMLTAHSLDMTNGDYIFLDVEIFQGSYWGDHDWKIGDENDTNARKAYEALLKVSLLQPTSDKFQEFADKVKQKSYEDYNYTISENEEINFVIGAFYDGVYLLGMALNETLHDGNDIRDGKRITERMWNRTFSGITGQVRIDSNGDRDADYSILDLNPLTGKFDVVGHYKGSSKEYIPVSYIHWPGNRMEAPPDVPKCGFMGNDPKCKHLEYYVFIHGSIVIGAILAFFGIVIFCMFRRSRRSLNETSWRIQLEELYPVPTLSGQTSSEPYRISSNRPSVSSTDLSQLTSVRMYRGNKVAIKMAQNKRIDINKKFLTEIGQVKEINHENTVRFVGVCLDCANPFIISEYCPRGSLKDVLENKDLKLEWNFRMSLVNDIVKGMIYLHQSEISVHGNLRSCNCLIDGRFVLKLSDFGLNILTTPTEIVRDNEYFRKLMWVAPELIPITADLIPEPNQKGDVYSFGIILEEIISREGPFQVAREVFNIPIADIILRVAMRESPPFRPIVQVLDCPEKLTELMQISWSDMPDDRPTFPQIQNHLYNFMRVFGENIIDDLLIRMEQYANNLEALVNEKTEELSQEKKRSEELLYQVLPRPVANQLMLGQIVKPEQFECVTIYFSDIVGFTSFCARATPMQVVDLLNELYSTFDEIITRYNVYKVETIGDAYMVVSGLPHRNGDNHAKEIALMALAILNKVKVFTFKQIPEFQLQVRIGIHSGSVCAGIVGQVMPHYCLFGDTVNTASRMESSGKPQKIHVSESTKNILESFGTFDLEIRGEVELKGKGTMTSYWLLRSTEFMDYSSYIIEPSVATETESAPYPLVFMGQTPPN
ncbi:unnamed protein product [Phyllotreta striolata]|uniref:Guanylate cyclase n=1 Tax=Phyllotreta striolata TaxID=444603 RepID=A0A9N9TRJ3_PHYSR|nr:unnamed protein product [Phyllotreta striolata]